MVFTHYLKNEVTQVLHIWVWVGGGWGGWVTMTLTIFTIDYTNIQHGCSSSSNQFNIMSRNSAKELVNKMYRLCTNQHWVI